MCKDLEKTGPTAEMKPRSKASESSGLAIFLRVEGQHEKQNR